MADSFLPDETTEKLRTYCRQRNNLISSASGASRRMQKFLKFLNFRLDVVVKDVCGLMASLKWLRKKYKENPILFPHWALVHP